MSDNPAVFGESLTFTAKLTSASANPTGTVTFYDGSTPLQVVSLTSLAATYTTTTLAAGSHSITVVYSGDANYTSVTSNGVTESVAATSGPAPTVQSVVINGGASQRSRVTSLTVTFSTTLHVNPLASAFMLTRASDAPKSERSL